VKFARGVVVVVASWPSSRRLSSSISVTFVLTSERLTFAMSPTTYAQNTWTSGTRRNASGSDTSKARSPESVAFSRVPVIGLGSGAGTGVVLVVGFNVGGGTGVVDSFNVVGAACVVFGMGVKVVVEGTTFRMMDRSSGLGLGKESRRRDTSSTVTTWSGCVLSLMICSASFKVVVFGVGATVVGIATSLPVPPLDAVVETWSSSGAAVVNFLFLFFFLHGLAGFSFLTGLLSFFVVFSTAGFGAFGACFWTPLYT